MTFSHLVLVVAVVGVIFAHPANRDLWLLACLYALSLWLGRFVPTHVSPTRNSRTVAVPTPVNTMDE